jgi:hypothetical protein
MCPDVTSVSTCVLEDGVSRHAAGQGAHGRYPTSKQTTNTLVSLLESTNSQIIISASHQHPECHTRHMCFLPAAARASMFDSFGRSTSNCTNDADYTNACRIWPHQTIRTLHRHLRFCSRWCVLRNAYGHGYCLGKLLDT